MGLQVAPPEERRVIPMVSWSEALLVALTTALWVGLSRAMVVGL